MSQDGQDLRELARQVAGWAADGEQVEAYVARAKETWVRAYAGEVESFTSSVSSGIGIRVLKGQRMGVAACGSLESEQVRQAFQEACSNALIAQEDPYAGFAEPDGVEVSDLDPWSEGATAMPSEEKVTMALELEKLATSIDPRVHRVSSADYADVSGEVAIVSTVGIDAYRRSSSASLSVSVFAEQGDEVQSATGFHTARQPQDLDGEHAAREAVERAARLLGATKPPSSTVTIVLDPRVTSAVVGTFASALSGEQAAKGRSMFANRLGEVVADPKVTLVDDPTRADAWGATSVDSEGLACRRNVLIEAGKLGQFLYDSRSARMAGVLSNGAAVRSGFASAPTPGARAMWLEAREEGLEGLGEILAAVGEGIYVQSVTGMHSGVNPVSGDFSVGIEGLVIKGGELGPPVREATIASTLQRMLLSVAFVGKDLEWLPGSVGGQTLAIADMRLSGT
jgi:PmbA protein